MERNNETLQNWLSSLEKEIKSSNLLDFDVSNKNVLRIMKDDFISLFNYTLEGNVSKICKLDNFLSLSQAISSYQKDHKLYGNELFTNASEKEQQETLKLIKETSENEIEKNSLTNAYLCFGLMRYNLDVFATASKQAPLVFIPITVLYDEDTDTYSIKGVKGEIFLNNVLLERIKKVRRVDLSYPLDSSFSIGEFLYYISVKIQSLNWNLSNQVFISNFDIYKYDNYVSIKTKSEKILSHDIVKKISYFNSQFYNFNTKNRLLLDSKYLSVIDMDNEEYSILKKVSSRDNLFIRTNDEKAKIHLISNTILSYALNNLKTLVVYGNYKEKKKLLEYIDNESYAKYVCDLDSMVINKNDLLADIVNYDNYLLPYRKAKETMISEDLQNFYDYKNNYKKLTNSLRTKDNALNTSLNQLISEYYRLDSLPLINITIHEPNKFSKDELSRHIEYVNSFANTVIKLNSKIEEHPFYGFKHNYMKKENFNELKENITLISSIMNDINTLISLGGKKYSYPLPNNLKEFKALLNILSFIDEYKEKEEWINDCNLLNSYYEVASLRERIVTSNKTKQELIQKYKRNILFIKEDLINEYLETNSSKLKAKIRKLLGKQVSLSSVDSIVQELDAYYKEIRSIKEESAKYDLVFIDMMRNDKLDELKKIIDNIYLFRLSLETIQNKNNFDVFPLIQNKNRNRIIHRRALQNAYNKLLASINIVKTYFNEEMYNFDTMDFASLEIKATNIATHFSSINDYLDFYKALIETNEFIYNLGDELIKYNPKDYRNLFLKKFYYDLINERIVSNPLLKEHTREKIYNELSNFYSSDAKRKGMIENIISNNIDIFLKKNLLRLKHDESDNIYHLFEKNLKHINLNYITANVKESLYQTKPCILCPYKAVAKYLNDPLYKFDLVIILGQKDMTMIDALPSLAISNNVIVFDEEYISKDPRKNVINNVALDDSLLTNAKNAYNISNYTSDKRNIVTHNSPLDASLKNHIANQLISHGFEIHTDYQIKNYIIDILVKVPNSKNIIALELNHLPYNSPEDAYSSFELEDKIISSLGFIPYRIFTSSFFFNEEIEMVNLIDFIVKKSDIISKPKTTKKEIRVMDYLFSEYKDPRLVYYQIEKSNLEFKDIVYQVIKETAPISLKELNLVIVENTKDSIKKLTNEKKIYVEDNFIYLIDTPIKFRRVNRQENFIRLLSTVSKKEIYDAIYKIIAHQNSIDQEVLVKMILLSLGYKKMKKEDYNIVIECIEFLLKEKIIFNDGTTLYRDLEGAQ